VRPGLPPVNAQLNFKLKLRTRTARLRPPGRARRAWTSPGCRVPGRGSGSPCHGPCRTRTFGVWRTIRTRAITGTVTVRRRPERGHCVNMTWDSEAKARARHRLESSLSGSRDSDGDGVSPVVDGSGPM
jgi:hypothetical protein